MKKFTLEMLAKMAGVGVATVDRVLNERGGVSPETTRKVLNAARAMDIKRPLPEAYQHPWQVEVFLSANPSHFFKQLAQDFADIAGGLGYRRITLHRTFIPESQPEKLAHYIMQSSEKRDGLIVFGHDYPIIHEALAHCRARGVPVVTIVTDLPGAARLCHVGINQQQAGRTAGLLMSKTARQPGDVIMVSGRVDYRAHQQRIAGFREAIAQRAPHLRLRELLCGQDQRDMIRSLLHDALLHSPQLVGIYNTGVGNTEIRTTLQQHQLLGDCVYITHELYSVTRALLQHDLASFTLDQNAAQHARLAMDILLRHLDTGEQPDLYRAGKVELKVITAENID
ncbi:LacI family DNA-binding transcriptional regulator [Nissabacter sp. SGAir0207]|uniref:LacI family DNA-binding transcriptional regulator n=1 Tax=Nissabacter sp. SGAir0207 TaxID=2126321 RepID=UPI0010CD3470|nr:LacI family DNA-binding transcriptional regulator [Nissabacter sp. SGAir0207]QCR38319.1 transcriptional regulator [Nissabacter sp. SGAir0207]